MVRIKVKHRLNPIRSRILWGIDRKKMVRIEVKHRLNPIRSRILWGIDRGSRKEK